MMITRYFLGFFLLLAYASLNAETLIEIYDTSLQSDPEYLSAIEINNASQEEISIARSNHLPSLSFSASEGRIQIADTSRTTTSYGANVSMDIFRYSNGVNSDIAQGTSAQAIANLKVAQQNLIIKVASRYFNVLAAEDGLVFSIAEKRAIARQLDQTKQRFEVGLVAITDVHEAQARFDFSVAQGIDAENVVDNAKESLREVTGLFHDNLAQLSNDTPLLKPKPANIDSWTNKALKQSLTLASSKQGINIARENINLAQAGYYPSISASVRYSVNPNTFALVPDPDNPGKTKPGTVEQGTTSGFLNLNYNFFSGGSTRARVRQAKHRLIQAKQLHEQQRRAVQRNARNSYLNVIAGISRVQALKQAVVSRKSAQRASEAGFEVGTKTTVDVLNSRRELFSAQNAYSQARYNYLLNTLKLQQAVADLSIKDLQRISSWMK